jgi:hypothetical protein
MNPADAYLVIEFSHWLLSRQCGEGPNFNLGIETASSRRGSPESTSSLPSYRAALDWTLLRGSHQLDGHHLTIHRAL